MESNTVWKKYLLTLFGVIEMIFFSGVIYGWANMVLILKSEGYFKDLCAPSENSTTKSNAEAMPDNCTGQDDRLTLVFTIAVFTFNAAGFLGGVLFDRLGTRVIRFTACFFFFLTGLFAFFLEKESANLTFAVIICLAIAGMLLAVSLFQIAQLHPKHRLAVSSSLSGTLDSSSVVFLIFKTCYDSGASLRWILITYAIIAIVFVLANTFVFLPKTSIELMLQGQEKVNARSAVDLGTANPAVDLGTANPAVDLGTANPGVEIDSEVETKEKESNEPVIVNSVTPDENAKYANGWRYVLTGRYVWLFYYLAFVQLRLWFFVGSLNTFLVFHTDNDQNKIDSYSRSFGIAQFFGFVFAPFTGIVMDLKPKSISNPYFGPILSFIITNLLCLLLGVLVLVPVLEVQYFSFVVQVAMRAFLYASLISFIIRAFPVIHYGKLYGVCNLAAAIVSLLQYPAFIILEGTFDGDPFWVNFVFLTLSFTAFGLPLYLWQANKKETEEITTSF